MSKDYGENWISLMNDGSTEEAKNVVIEAFKDSGVGPITDMVMADDKLHHLLPQLTMQCRFVTQNHFVFG